MFEHLVLLGGQDYLADYILDIGLARQVSRDVPAPQSADALVLLHDAPIELEQAIACLRPGGVLYYEASPLERHGWARVWEMRRRLRRLARMQHRLRRLHLVDVVPYWVHAHFDAATWLMPLADAHSLRWYLRTLVVARTPAQRIAAALVRWSPLPVHMLVERFAACRAYVARMAPASIPTMPGYGPLSQPLTPPGTTPFVLAGGETDLKRVVIFPFPKTSARPSAVLKVSRYAESNIDAVIEQAVLARIRATLGEEMRRTVPRPLALLRDGPFIVDVESYSDGRTLSATSAQALTPLHAKHRDMERVGAWLLRFHQETTVERTPWDAAARARWIEEPLAQYARIFGTTADEQRLFAAARARALLLDGLDMPLVWQHHNFGEWNLLRTRHGINVIDWEHARIGLPLCDLHHFALYWTLTVRCLCDPDAQERGFRDLFCAPEPIDASVAVARRTMATYLVRLAIDPRFGPLLVVYTWVEKALWRAASETLGNTRRYNRSVRYVELLSQDAHNLFLDAA